jgi:hypothetical protein
MHTLGRLSIGTVMYRVYQMVHTRIGVKRGLAPYGRLQARQGYAGDAYGVCGNAIIQLVDMRGDDQARYGPRNVIISIDIALTASPSQRRV